MLKNCENNAIEELGLVTPTPCLYLSYVQEKVIVF